MAMPDGPAGWSRTGDDDGPGVDLSELSAVEPGALGAWANDATVVGPQPHGAVKTVRARAAFCGLEV
jgi:hypothetical protein